MSSIKAVNGRVQITPTKARVGNLSAGIQNDEAVNMSQYNTMQAQINTILAGTITLTTIEAGDGTVALPSYTYASDLDTGFYRIGANNVGFSANGAKVLDIATTGLAVTGLISATTSVTATTSISLGTDLTGLKEVNHTITVATTTTAATAGGNITVLAATGATSGAGGNVSITGGTGGATAASLGGNVTVTSGVSGAGGGASGTVSAKSGIGTSSTGTADFGSGAASAGTSGNVTLSSGTGTTATGTVTVSTSNATTTAGALNITTGTAATTGGIITISTGNISAGTSAAVTLTSGTGTTGTGAFLFTSGNASAGGSGAAGFTTGTGTTSTGAITFTTGNASAGTAGNIVLTCGTTSSTTVSPLVIATSNIVSKRITASVASGGTITGKQIADGYIEGTGGTGNWQMPTAAQITTAIGATPAGTTVEFVFNATNMTATNVATLLVGANIVAMKQTSAGDSATSQLLTVTQTSGTQVGIFRLVYDTATSCTLHRMA